MSGTSIGALAAASVRHVVVSTWPAELVVTATASRSAATSAEALTAAFDEIAPALAAVPPQARAVVVGTATASTAETLRFVDEIHTVGAALVNPALFPPTVMNAPAGLAAIAQACEGPNVTLANGVTSALDAIAHAADLIADGIAEVAVAGGFEAAWPPQPGAGARAVVWSIMSARTARRHGAPVCLHLAAAATGRADPARLIEAAHGASPAGTAADLARAASAVEVLALLAAPHRRHGVAMLAHDAKAAKGTVLVVQGPRAALPERDAARSQRRMDGSR